MDYRMKNWKDTHLNYHSVAQLPRNFAASKLNEDRPTHYKSKDYTVEISSPLPFLRTGKQNHPAQTQLQIRLDSLQNRLQALENSHYRNNSVPMILSKKLDNPRDLRNSFTSPSPTIQEFSLLKQSLQNELLSHQDQLRANQQKHQKLQMRLGLIEQDFRQYLNAQHQEMSMKWMSHKEELKGQEYFKQSNNEQQMEALKYSINLIQEKVNEDRQKKVKEDVTVKQQIYKQLANVRDQFSRISNQERQQNQKWLKQLKQTLTDLKSSQETDRAQVREAINQVQNLFDHRFSILHKNLDSVAQGSIYQSNKIDKKLTSFKSQWLSFKVNLEEKVEEHRASILNLESNKMEGQVKSEYEGGSEKLLDFKEEIKQWKRVVEQKNLIVFKEMANALKTMRLEWQSEQENMGKHISELSRTVTTLKKTTRKQLKNDMQQIVGIMSEEFDILTQQLETVSELMASAKRELEQKLEQSCLKQVANLKALVENTANSLKQQLSVQDSKIAGLQDRWTRALQAERTNWRNESQQAEKKQQSKLDTFIDTLNRQNQEWTSQLNLSITTFRSQLTQKLQDNASTYSKQIEEQTKKIHSLVHNVKSEMQQGLEATSTTLKKHLQEALASQRTQTAKQISKNSDQLISVITDSTNKSKKQREKLEKDIVESLEQLKKNAKSDIAALKATLDTRLGEIKSRQSQKQGDQEKKYSQMKSYVEQSLLRQEKIVLDELSKSTKRIDRVESLVSSIKSEVLIQVEKVTRQSITKSKAKEEELVARQLELEKRINDGLAKTRKELAIQIEKLQKDNSTNKVKEEELKNKQLQFQKRFIESLGKIKSDLGTDVSKVKTLLTEQNNKWKSEMEARVKAGDEAKAKKQLDLKTKEQELRSKQAEFAAKAGELQKKVEALLNVLKKQIQKATADDLAKLKIQIDQRLKASKNDSELRAREDLDKKIQMLIGTARREIEGAVQKDNKQIRDEVNKLQLDAKKLRSEVESGLKDGNEHQQGLKLELGSKLEQVAKKQQALKDELGRKMAEVKGMITVSTKSQQAEFNKLQDQRLQHLRADLSSQFRAMVDDLVKENRALRGMIGESREQTKQVVNRLQAGVFSEREKNKAMYEKLSKDLLEMTDNLGLLMSEVGIHN